MRFDEIALAGVSERLGESAQLLVTREIAPGNGDQIGSGQHVIPTLEFQEHAHQRDQPLVKRAIIVVLVGFGIARRRQQIAGPQQRDVGQAELFLDVTKIISIVRVVPGLEGQRELLIHVTELHPRRAIHGPRGFVPQAHLGVVVPRHVVRMADVGRNQTVTEATGQPLLGCGRVPVVNAVMVCAGMIRFLCEHLLQHEFGTQSMAGVDGEKGEERLGFDVIWIFQHELLQPFGQDPGAFLAVQREGLAGERSFPRFDVETFARTHCGFTTGRLAEEVEIALQLRRV